MSGRRRMPEPEPAPESGWIMAMYHCPHCKRTVPRDVRRVTKTRKSYCQKVGRTVLLKLVKS